LTAPRRHSEQRAPSTNRLNRGLLLLVGLVLLLGGLAGLLTGLGVFGSAAADTPVLPESVSRFTADQRYWFWPLVGLVALVLGLLALWWLLRQGRTTDIPELELEPDRDHGGTQLSADALTDAVSGEIKSYRGVAGASARLLGSRAAPRLSLRVRLDGRADPGEVRRRIESEAVAHARQVVANDRLPVRLELVVPRSTSLPVAAADQSAE
jgi:hypothetical protein